MKLKIKYLFVLMLMTFLGTIGNVRAVNITSDELGDTIESIKPDASFAYIIGKYVYTDEMVMSTKDIMLGTLSIDLTDKDGKTNKDSIYNEMRILYAEWVGTDAEGHSKWNIKNYIGSGDIPTNYDLRYVDYQEVKEVIKYTVTFDNDGTTNSVTVREGKVVDKPTDPTKEGYKFIGWYNGEEAYDFTSPVTSDLTLTAKYVVELDIDALLQNSVNKINNEYYTATYTNKVITYTILSNDIKSSALKNTGLIGGIRDLLKTEGVKELTIKSGEKTYIFDDPNENLEVGQSSIVFLTMVQMLEETTGKTVSDITLEDLIGTELDVIIATKDGFISTTGKTVEQYKAVITGEKTPVYTVTFNIDGTETSKQVRQGKTIEEPETPTKDGYTFIGWYTDSELTTEYEFTSEVNSNMTLYAKFDINTYNVKFMDGENELSDLEQTVQHGKTISSVVTPAKEGYTFEGWYTDSELTTKYELTSEVNSNMTLYAKWKQVVANVTTQAELEAALANSDIVTINLVNNIEVNKSIIISRSVVINGNSNTMSMSTVTSGNNQVLKTYSGLEEINVELKNIKLTGANAALIVLDNSRVIANNVDVSGNAWGGIEVKNVATSSLVATNIANTNEEEGHATVWVDETTVAGMLANVAFEDKLAMDVTGSNGQSQVQYYLSQPGNIDGSNDNKDAAIQSVTDITDDIISNVQTAIFS